MDVGARPIELRFILPFQSRLRTVLGLSRAPFKLGARVLADAAARTRELTDQLRGRSGISVDVVQRALERLG